MSFATEAIPRHPQLYSCCKLTLSRCCCTDRLLSALLREAGQAGSHHLAIAISLVKPTVSCWRAAAGSGLSSDRHLEICQSAEVLCRTLYGPSHHSTLAAANRSCEVLCSRADRESISAALDKWRSLMILCGKGRSQSIRLHHT